MRVVVPQARPEPPPLTPVLACESGYIFTLTFPSVVFDSWTLEVAFGGSDNWEDQGNLPAGTPHDFSSDPPYKVRGMAKDADGNQVGQPSNVIEF